MLGKKQRYDIPYESIFLMSGEGKIRETKASGFWGLEVVVGYRSAREFWGAVIELFCILILVMVIQVCRFIKSHRRAPAGDGPMASTRYTTELPAVAPTPCSGLGEPPVRTLRPRGM